MYDWEKQIAKCSGAGQKSNKTPCKSEFRSDCFYNRYGALFVDDHTGYKWLYGLKTKDEALNAAKRWMAEIADLREKYPLLVVMRDNAKENSSKAICDYFTTQPAMNHGKTDWRRHRSSRLSC